MSVTIAMWGQEPVIRGFRWNKENNVEHIGDYMVFIDTDLISIYECG